MNRRPLLSVAATLGLLSITVLAILSHGFIKWHRWYMRKFAAVVATLAFALRIVPIPLFYGGCVREHVLARGFAPDFAEATTGVRVDTGMWLDLAGFVASSIALVAVIMFRKKSDFVAPGGDLL